MKSEMSKYTSEVRVFGMERRNGANVMFQTQWVSERYKGRCNESSVFVGEVYDLRLHPGGGNFRPPPGAGNLGAGHGGRDLGLRSFMVLPALAVTPLFFGNLDLSSG